MYLPLLSTQINRLCIKDFAAVLSRYSYVIANIRWQTKGTISTQTHRTTSKTITRTRMQLILP